MMTKKGGYICLMYYFLLEDEARSMNASAAVAYKEMDCEDIAAMTCKMNKITFANTEPYIAIFNFTSLLNCN